MKRENVTKISKITSFLLQNLSTFYLTESKFLLWPLLIFPLLFASFTPQTRRSLSHQVKEATTLSVPQTRTYTFSSRPSYYLFQYQEGSSQRYPHPHLLLQVCLKVILSKCPFLTNLLKQYPYYKTLFFLFYCLSSSNKI